MCGIVWGSLSLLLSVYVCKCVSPYLSELPDNTRGFEFPIIRAVPHPNGGMSLEYLSTQLCHRVETDLLLRCVFKVLEQKRDVVMWVTCSVYIQHECMFLYHEMETTLVRNPRGKAAVNDIQTLLCLFSNYFGTSLFLP